MLTKMLSRSTCAACRLCCRFDASDIWELPVLPPETVTAVQKRLPDVKLVPVGAEQTFAAPPLKGEELFACPMLTDHGCGLSEQEKPFDCQIWPFRLMRTKNGKVGIAISELCSGMQSYSDAQLQTFLQEGLAETIFAYAEQHPAHIKPWMEGYRMILQQDA
ncbi:MAG: hypothetical protein Q4D37_01350 [Oscillospiraceae bacterium]|nr:hypothetical protein [Oscillospiraceae bacterium]